MGWAIAQVVRSFRKCNQKWESHGKRFYQYPRANEQSE